MPNPALIPEPGLIKIIVCLKLIRTTDLLFLLFWLMNYGALHVVRLVPFQKVFMSLARQPVYHDLSLVHQYIFEIFFV